MADSLTSETAGSVQWTGSAWENVRGNFEVTLKESGLVTADWTSADQTNTNHSSVTVFFNLTATSGTTPIVDNVQIQSKDPASGVYQNLTDLTTVGSTNGLYVMQVGPGAGDAGGQLAAAQNVLLPRTWRVQVLVDRTTGDETYTFSVGASVVGV